MEKEVIFVTVERALSLCARSLGDDLDVIKSMLTEKKAEAFLIDKCCFITRFETVGDHKELVVMCAEGKGLNAAGDVLRVMAKNHGCTTARMHTQRPALQKLASQFGWVQHEIIFKMEI